MHGDVDHVEAERVKPVQAVVPAERQDSEGPIALVRGIVRLDRIA